jgi:hypothetical protein
MDINIFLHTLLVLYIVKDQQPLGLERENIGLGNIYICTQGKKESINWAWYTPREDQTNMKREHHVLCRLCASRYV